MTDPGPTQRRDEVDARFAAEHAYWVEIYTLADDASAVYRRRHALALVWIDALSLDRDSQVLDVGCGAGVMGIDLARRGLRVRAVDRVQEMVDETRGRARAAGLSDRIEVEIADATALPFESGTFGLVVALGLIPWLESRADGLSELVRVTAPNGHLLVSDDNRYSLELWLDPLKNPLLRPVSPCDDGSSAVAGGRSAPRAPLSRRYRGGGSSSCSWSAARLRLGGRPWALLRCRCSASRSPAQRRRECSRSA